MIISHLPQPAPEHIRAARERAGLSQEQAALLVSAAAIKPYRTWQSYEADQTSVGHRRIPVASWELFLLRTDQHPTHKICDRRTPKRVRNTSKTSQN